MHVIKCVTAVSEGRCFILQNVEPSDKKIRNIWSVVKEQHGCAMDMGVKHQERTCQHKFCTKLIKTENSGFSFKA